MVFDIITRTSWQTIVLGTECSCCSKQSVEWPGSKSVRATLSRELRARERVNEIHALRRVGRKGMNAEGERIGGTKGQVHEFTCSCVDSALIIQRLTRANMVSAVTVARHHHGNGRKVAERPFG